MCISVLHFLCKPKKVEDQSENIQPAWKDTTRSAQGSSCTLWGSKIPLFGWGYVLPKNTRKQLETGQKPLNNSLANRLHSKAISETILQE